MKWFHRLRDLMLAALSATAFLAGLALVVVLALGLLWRAITLQASVAPALRALEESLAVALLAVPPAVVIGTFLALYWVEYRDEPMGALGRPLVRELARLPSLLVAVIAILLLPESVRATRAAAVLAVFVPAFFQVATAATALFAGTLPVYRDAVLALGVRRHRWMLASVRKVMARAVLGVALLALARAVGVAAPLLLLAPGARTPLSLLLVFHPLDEGSAALAASVLFALVVALRLTAASWLRASPLAQGNP